MPLAICNGGFDRIVRVSDETRPRGYPQSFPSINIGGQLQNALSSSHQHPRTQKALWQCWRYFQTYYLHFYLPPAHSIINCMQSSRRWESTCLIQEQLYSTTTRQASYGWYYSSKGVFTRKYGGISRMPWIVHQYGELDNCEKLWDHLSH